MIIYWLMLPKKDALNRYDPMDIEQGFEKGGWIGVVSACSEITLREVAVMQNLKQFKIAKAV